MNRHKKALKINYSKPVLKDPSTLPTQPVQPSQPLKIQRFEQAPHPLANVLLPPKANKLESDYTDALTLELPKGAFEKDARKSNETVRNHCRTRSKLSSEKCSLESVHMPVITTAEHSQFEKAHSLEQARSVEESRFQKRNPSLAAQKCEHKQSL